MNFRIDEKSEFYYLNRPAVSKLEVIKLQNDFYKILTHIIKSLKNQIFSLNFQKLEKETVSLINLNEQGDPNLHRSPKDCYTWKYKEDFENFFKSIMNDSHFIDRLFLKVKINDKLVFKGNMDKFKKFIYKSQP